MESKKKEKKEFTSKHFVLLYFIALMLILTFFGVMNWLGYSLINMGVEYLLFGLLIVSAMIGGLVLLLRRLSRKAVKIIVGVPGVLLIFAAAVVMLTVFTVMLNLNTPSHYATLDNPNGGAVVVMREWGSDADLVDLRAETRWANDPDAVEGEYLSEDLGYSYFAAPRTLGIFYDTARKNEGYLEIGVNSEAQLMYQWEEATLKMYIENAEIGDKGETTLAP